ncbi:unnamed protein product [Amoebophrya sp. A120]|nr:unnamed protein product [Amoebophrya sp. A120]|eukprot:GSA120T00011007001.1
MSGDDGGDVEMGDAEEVVMPFRMSSRLDAAGGNQIADSTSATGAVQEQGAVSSTAAVAPATTAAAAPPQDKNTSAVAANNTISNGNDSAGQLQPVQEAPSIAVEINGAATTAAQKEDGAGEVVEHQAVVVEEENNQNQNENGETNVRGAAPNIVLVPNQKFLEQWKLKEGELDSVIILAGLDQCQMGQIWALFNGKVPQGTVTNIHWISDHLLRCECASAEACNTIIELLTVKYPTPDLLPQEEREGPGIWRCRNRFVEVRRALPTDVKPEGFKRKQRGGKTVKEYRGDVKWCAEQGHDTNFATKLALKAKAMEQWTELVEDDVQQSVNLETDVISTTHLLDMMSKKDEKAYTAQEVKGVPPAQKGARTIMGPPMGPPGAFRGKGGNEVPVFNPLGDGGSSWGGNHGRGDWAPLADHENNRDMEGFLDYLQESDLQSSWDATSVYGTGSGNTSSVYGGGSSRRDPYGTPQQRMQEFDRYSSSNSRRPRYETDSNIDSSYGQGGHEVLTNERRRFDEPQRGRERSPRRNDDRGGPYSRGGGQQSYGNDDRSYQDRDRSDRGYNNDRSGGNRRGRDDYDDDYDRKRRRR